jgi:hypothetical protein
MWTKLAQIGIKWKVELFTSVWVGQLVSQRRVAMIRRSNLTWWPLCAIFCGFI